MADILTDADSPVDNLPVAAGGKRRGRPRKVRIDDAASNAAAVAAASLPLQAEEIKKVVKEAVTAAVSKPKPPAPAPESPKGIAGLEKEIKRAATKRKIRQELKRTGASDLAPATDELVEEAISRQSVESIRQSLASEARPPHWWLLRMR